MPYKDLSVRTAKAREYMAAHRLREKAKIALLEPEPRFCLLCSISIIDKRKGAKYCCRDHKRIASDAKRNHAAEYGKNKTNKRAQALKYYYLYIDRNRQLMRERQKCNLPVFAASAAKRRAVKIQRTPNWLSKLDIWLIEEIYVLAALRTKLTGVVWHVDHIVPLQGELVSGLHIPVNLQVITAKENMYKSNKFEVA